MYLLPPYTSKKINVTDKNDRFFYCGINVGVVVGGCTMLVCKNPLLLVYILNNFFYTYKAKLLTQYYFYQNVLFFNMYWRNIVLTQVIATFFYCNLTIVPPLLYNYSYQQRIITNFTCIGYKLLEKFNFFFFKYFFSCNSFVKRKNFKNFR